MHTKPGNLYLRTRSRSNRSRRAPLPADRGAYRLTACLLLLVANASFAFESVDEAVRALGAQRHADRQAASAYILEQGRDAVPAVEAAVESRDPEIRMRARDLLDALLRQPVGPDGTAGVMVDIPGSENKTALEKVEALLNSAETNKYAWIYGILASQQAEDEREKIIATVRENALQGKRSEMVLAGGRAWDLLEECLKKEAETGSTYDGHIKASDYAAWCMFRGTLDNRIAEAQTHTNSPAQQDILLWLTAAQHSPDEAWKRVRRSRNSRTQFPMVTGSALEGGLQHVLRATAARSRNATQTLRLLGVYHRQMRNDTGLRSTIAAVKATAESLQAAGIEQSDYQLDSLADTMLLLGDAERAAAILGMVADPALDFSFQMARFRFAEADAVATAYSAVHTNVPPDFQEALDFFRFSHMAPEEQARQLTTGAKDIATTGTVDAAVELIFRAVLTDHVPLAAETAIALDRTEKLSLDRSLSLFPADVQLWYRALALRHTDRKSADILKHAVEVHNEPRTSLQVADMLKTVLESIDGRLRNTSDALRWWYDIVTVGALMRDTPSLPYLGTEIDLRATRAEALVVVGDCYADAGQLQRAMEYYRTASDDDPASPLPLYLQALGLEAQGKDADARALKRTALLLTDNEAQRCTLLRELCYRHREDEALKLWALRYRLGIPNTFDEIGLALHLLEHAREEEERARLIAVLEYAEPCLYLMGARRRVARLATLRAYEGHHALERDDLLTALRFYDEAVACSVANVDLYIDAVARLRAKGHRQPAERISQKVEDILRDNLRVCPRSPICANALAWFLACTHRKLDDALALAEGIVKACPRTASYIDTLAEVHFRLGHREKAVELQKQAIALEPRTHLLHERLKGFQTAPLPQPSP